MSASRALLQSWHTQEKFKGWKVVGCTFTEPAKDGHAYFIVNPEGTKTAFVFNGAVSRVFPTSKNFQARSSTSAVDEAEAEFEDPDVEGDEETLLDGVEPDGVEVYFNEEGTNFAFVVFLEGMKMLCVNHRLIPVHDEVVGVQFAPLGDSYTVYFTGSRGGNYAQLKLEEASWLMHGNIDWGDFSDDGKHFFALVDPDSRPDTEARIIFLDGEELKRVDAFQSWNLPRCVRLDETGTERFLMDRESRWVLCGWFEERALDQEPVPVVGLVSLSDRSIQTFPGIRILSAKCSEFYPGFDLMVLTAEDEYSSPHPMSIPLR